MHSCIHFIHFVHFFTIHAGAGGDRGGPLHQMQAELPLDSLAERVNNVMATFGRLATYFCDPVKAHDPSQPAAFFNTIQDFLSNVTTAYKDGHKLRKAAQMLAA
jgi:hypothetical protein